MIAGQTHQIHGAISVDSQIGIPILQSHAHTPFLQQDILQRYSHTARVRVQLCFNVVYVYIYFYVILFMSFRFSFIVLPDVFVMHRPHKSTEEQNLTKKMKP